MWGNLFWLVIVSFHQVQTQSWAAVATSAPRCYKPLQLCLKWLPRYLKGWYSFFLTLYFSIVSLLEVRLGHLRTRIFQSNHIYKRFYQVMPRGRYRLRRDQWCCSIHVVHVSVQNLLFSQYTLRRGLLDHQVAEFLHFTSISFFLFFFFCILFIYFFVALLFFN